MISVNCITYSHVALAKLAAPALRDRVASRIPELGTETVKQYNLAKMDYDVVIIGGGPAGSTTGAFLKKYDPNLKVAIFEREKFPRDHVGESQLPITSYYLDEMGVWDRVEAAGFPIKIGATYKWGKTKELWDFDFIAGGKLEDQPRPAKFEGQRRFTAFQVDRAHYDKILLDYAGELGCEVFEEIGVKKVDALDDAVTSVTLSDGRTVRGTHYIDASGRSGIIRQAMGIETEVPTRLQNVAVWDYWENAEWAESIGVGGTRVQVMSVNYGWIWFIPLGPTRTSVGLVMPAEYLKSSGKKLEELYKQALSEEKRIAYLMRNAKSEGKMATTNDWSFLSKRLYGENWFLVGESAGFADPILAAGLSITHAAGREAAFTILELNRGKEKPHWLKEEYEKLQFNRVRNHIRFADYWYSANEQFKDLQDFTKQIADDNGLELTPEKAWAWLAQGGFIDDDHVAGTATLSLSAIRGLGKYMSPLASETPLAKYNVFRLNLNGAKFKQRARYEHGTVTRYEAYMRDGKLLPLTGVYKVIFDILQQEHTVQGFFKRFRAIQAANMGNAHFKTWISNRITVGMEAMIEGGWVTGSLDPNLPAPHVDGSGTTVMHWHDETRDDLRELIEQDN